MVGNNNNAFRTEFREENRAIALFSVRISRFVCIIIESACSVDDHPCSRTDCALARNVAAWQIIDNTCLIYKSWDEPQDKAGD